MDSSDAPNSNYTDYTKFRANSLKRCQERGKGSREYKWAAAASLNKSVIH